MEKINGIMMDFQEYKEMLEEISNGEASIVKESGSWFYVSSGKYDTDKIEYDLSEYLSMGIIEVNIDASKDKNSVIIQVV